MTAVALLTAEEIRAIVREAVRSELDAAQAGDILTLEQAAELVKRHPKVLVRYIRTMGLPAQRIGRDWRFNRGDLLDWLRKQPTAKAPK